MTKQWEEGYNRNKGKAKDGFGEVAKQKSLEKRERGSETPEISSQAKSDGQDKSKPKAPDRATSILMGQKPSNVMSGDLLRDGKAKAEPVDAKKAEAERDDQKKDSPPDKEKPAPPPPAMARRGVSGPGMSGPGMGGQSADRMRAMLQAQRAQSKDRGPERGG